MVNNNAEPGTSEEIASTEARQVFETAAGLRPRDPAGAARGERRSDRARRARRHLRPEDIRKLLVYSDECDAVLGTRTTRELIWHGANMEWFLRWGNWAVAKLVETLFNTSHLSDVGCTYRLFNREMADRVASEMTVGGNHAGAEILLVTIVSGATLRRGAGQLPARASDAPRPPATSKAALPSGCG